MVVEVSVVKKMLCGVYGKPQSEKSERPLSFWSRTVPSEAKNYKPFGGKNPGMLLGPDRECLTMVVFCPYSQNYPS